jgi:iron(III) transport system ATP-binding protein
MSQANNGGRTNNGDALSEPIIEFDHVSKRYGTVVAVNDVSVTVQRGTLLTLLGPSGCGKTTILRMIAGLELPSSGTIRIDGRDVTTTPAHERNVAMVFQSYALFPHMTVLQNVCYGLTVSGVAPASAQQRARQAMATVGLEGYDQRLPSQLSGGQQQRVAVARAIVLEPAVLLFDEPLSNLDSRLRRQMRDDIRQLQQRLALTVVYVTHDQGEAMAVSDQIIVMNKAVIAQQGTPQQVYREPVDAFVASFMGESNRLRARLRRLDDVNGDFDFAGLHVQAPHRGASDGDIEVMVRPEAISIAGRDATPLHGVVRKVAYLGATMEYTIECSLGSCFVVTPAGEERAQWGVGALVGLKIEPFGIVVVR